MLVAHPHQELSSSFRHVPRPCSSSAIASLSLRTFSGLLSRCSFSSIISPPLAR